MRNHMSLHVQSLTCIRQDRLIFNSVDLSLNPGEILWVKGRNGAGKSSLLRILAGLLTSASGLVLWKGKDIEDDQEQYLQNIRYIGHQDALKTAFTARENLEFWCRFSGSDLVDTALKALHLEAIADHPVRIMSAGQKKRSNLARLIACPAPLWILDEPISSLDVHYIDLFKTLLKEHVASGGMVLLATHQDLGIEGIRHLDLDKVSEAVQ